jgi:hypothetical protein
MWHVIANPALNHTLALLARLVWQKVTWQTMMKMALNNGESTAWRSPDLRSFNFRQQDTINAGQREVHPHHHLNLKKRNSTTCHASKHASHDSLTTRLYQPSSYLGTCVEFCALKCTQGIVVPHDIDAGYKFAFTHDHFYPFGACTSPSLYPTVRVVIDRINCLL